VAKASLSRQQLLVYAREGAHTRIVQLRKELAALEAAFGGRGRVAKPAAAAAPKKRRMSAEGRKRIADAARKRWAKWRADKKKEK
jgi:hypothetical protein